MFSNQKLNLFYKNIRYFIRIFMKIHMHLWRYNAKSNEDWTKWSNEYSNSTLTLSSSSLRAKNVEYRIGKHFVENFAHVFSKIFTLSLKNERIIPSNSDKSVILMTFLVRYTIWMEISYVTW